MFVIVYGFRRGAYKPTQALSTSSGQINAAFLKCRKEKTIVKEKGYVGCSQHLSYEKTSGECC